jgi:hypothetical protein
MITPPEDLPFREIVFQAARLVAPRADLRHRFERENTLRAATIRDDLGFPGAAPQPRVDLVARRRHYVIQPFN